MDKYILENAGQRLIYHKDAGKLFLEGSFPAEAVWKLKTAVKADDFTKETNRYFIEMPLPPPQDVKAGTDCIQAVHRWLGKDGQLWSFQWSLSTMSGGFLALACLGLIRGKTCEAAFELNWTVKGRPEEFYSLFPGSVYAHNKADNVLYDRYPPRLNDFKHVDPEGPRWMGDIPRFTQESGYELIQQTTDLTYPAASIYSDKNGAGMWLWASAEDYPVIHGFALEAGQCCDEIQFGLRFPSMRKKRYRHCAHWENSEDKGFIISPGRPVSAGGGFGTVIAESRPDFISEIARLRINPEPVTAVEPVIPYSEAVSLAEMKINKLNWSSKDSFYADETGTRLQTGWVGGTVTCYCMLHSKDEKTRERAVKTLKFIVEKGASPSGLLYGIFEDGKWYGAGEKTDGLDFAGRFVRRIGDALYGLLKIIESGILTDERLVDKCKASAVKCLGAFSNMAEKYGHFGSHIDFITGDILWGGSTAGAVVLGCLVKGSRVFGRGEWLESAEKAAAYYEKFLYEGCTIGGPGDILMAADSESAYAMVESFWLLYEAAKDERYLKDCIMAADYFATWVYRKSYSLPQDSTHGKLGINPLGLVMANVQNKCGAPGICTASGKVLLSLYEEIGDRLYIDLLADIKKAVPQLMCRYPGHIHGIEVGNIPENVNVSDSLMDRGEVYKSGHWTELALCISHIELPSVYIDRKRKVFILDHCLAGLQGNVLEITNPTAYKGDFSIAFNGKITWITLNSFETKQVEVSGN